MVYYYTVIRYTVNKVFAVSPTIKKWFFLMSPYFFFLEDKIRNACENAIEHPWLVTARENNTIFPGSWLRALLVKIDVKIDFCNQLT